MTNTTSGTRSQAPFPAVSTGRTEPQRPGRTTVSSASPVQNYHRPPTGEHRRSAHRRTARSRGHLTRWLVEVAPGVFVGNPSRRVRDNLWPVLADRIADGQAVMIEPADNEQGWSFRTAGRHRWHPVDLDGLILVGRPRRQSATSARVVSARAGFTRLVRRARLQVGGRPRPRGDHPEMTKSEASTVMSSPPARGSPAGTR